MGTVSLLSQYSPAPPAAWRLRAAICGCLMLALAAGCQQWSGQPLPWTTLFEGAGDHVAGSANWKDVYRIESPDVLRLELVRGEAAGLDRTYAVSPDGAIDLGEHGKAYVAGKSLPAATRAVEHHLARTLDRPKIALSVAEHKSPYFYVITQRSDRGDAVTRLPLGESDTVLDAISQIGGLRNLSSTDIWIRRPAGSEVGRDEILPIDWEAITHGNMEATNYRLMPGDVVYVAEDESCGRPTIIRRLPEPSWKQRVSGRIAAGIRNVRSVCSR